MELWQTITAAILGNAVVIAVLGWLAKSFLESVAARDSKRFEGDLKAKADAAIEELKNQLQLRVVTHQIKLANLHEKRALTIAQMNSLLAEVAWEAESFLSPIEYAGEPDKREKHAAAMTKLTEFFRYFDNNKIYLPGPLCSSMERLVREVRLHVIKFGVYVQLEANEPLLPHTQKEKSDAWLAGWKALSTEVPAVRSQLEEEFRALLAPDA